MSRGLCIDDLYGVPVPTEPTLSPDGSQVAYVITVADKDTDSDVTSIWCLACDTSSEPRPLTGGPADSTPIWSPSGDQLAFLRRVDGVPQIFVLPSAGGTPKQLTHHPRGAGSPAWAPDEQRIAFSALVDPIPTVQSGHAPAPFVTSTLGYRVDGLGLIGHARSQLHVVDVRTTHTRQLSEHTGGVSTPRWSPDGSTVVGIASEGPDSDVWGTSACLLFAVQNPEQTPRRLGFPAGVTSFVDWLSDGESLLVGGTPNLEAGHTRLYRVPLDGSALTELAAGTDRNVMTGGIGYPGGHPQAADLSTVLFCLRDAGCTHLYRCSVTSDGPAQGLVSGQDQVVTGFSVASNRVAVVLADASSFGELVVLALADLQPTRPATGYTRQALAARGGVAPMAAAPCQFTAPDGSPIQGWLLRDPAAPRPSPMLLDMHGGPHNAWNGALDLAHLYQHQLAAQGWAVLTLNVRGSDGYGEAFYRAAVGGWGIADEQDFLSPIDVLVEEGTAEPTKLAVTGYSYGGFMTCHLTSRTGRFAAAAAGGLLCDLVSWGGTADEGPQFSRYEHGGQVHVDPAVLRSQSPIQNVGAVTTPTLVLHGLEDLRCPPGQAEQWFTALRVMGVPTELVLYAEETHTFPFSGAPSHRADYGERLVRWFHRHVASQVD